MVRHLAFTKHQCSPVTIHAKCGRTILVDTFGLIIASRVEPANMPDQRAGAGLLAGLRAIFPQSVR